MELDISALKRTYFSCDERKISLAKGDTLLNEGDANQRLFIVHKGLLAGYGKNPDGTPFKLFNAEPDSFVGVVSFFSMGFTITATVMAEEATELFYLDWSIVENSRETRREFLALFMPVVVLELLDRQREIKKISLEKEQTFKKLIESEKMAYLGQMAAGIAHELNNSIAVVESNSTWLGEKMDKEIEEVFPENFSVFRAGLEKGNRLTSSQIRKRAGNIEEQLGIDMRLARKLAQTEIPVGSLSGFDGNKRRMEKVCDLWELGSVVHDIKVASDQASHVVKSVKALGRPEPEHREYVDVNDTVFSALTLLRYQLKDIKNDFFPGETGKFKASKGNLVQIWVNLIKNAAESLTQAKTKDPVIMIKSFRRDENIVVEVEDNGPGIPEERQQKIFQPNVTTKVEGLSFGLGLGLSIVKRLIEIYNGDIELVSREGRTLFTVTLPDQLQKER